jgi:hypothetical protein
MSSGSFSRNINTLLILVSITGSGRFRENAQIALAVYGHIHGSVRSFSLLCGNVQLYSSKTFFAHSWSLIALELNHNQDQ